MPSPRCSNVLQIWSILIAFYWHPWAVEPWRLASLSPSAPVIIASAQQNIYPPQLAHSPKTLWGSQAIYKGGGRLRLLGGHNGRLGPRVRN